MFVYNVEVSKLYGSRIYGILFVSKVCIRIYVLEMLTVTINKNLLQTNDFLKSTHIQKWIWKYSKVLPFKLKIRKVFCVLFTKTHVLFVHQQT